jgi:hypothetical protein
MPSAPLENILLRQSFSRSRSTRTSQITLRLFFFSVDDNNPERLVVVGGGGYMCRQLTDSAGRSLAKGEDGLNGKEEMSDAHPTFKENMRIFSEKMRLNDCRV